MIEAAIQSSQMPGRSVLGLTLLVSLVIASLLWFALGTQRNISRGNAFLGWLQGGLPVLGRKATLRWLGSTAVVLDIVHPHHPFLEAEVLVVLEPRDVGLLWAWARSRRRRDFLILRGRLHRSPRYEVEAGHLRGWTGRDRLRRLDSAVWVQAEWDDPDVSVSHTSEADLETVRRIWRDLERSSGDVWRLSIRRTPPHVEVHVIPPDIRAAGAEPLIRTFLALGSSVSAS